jgi:hypothetical protein
LFRASAQTVDTEESLKEQLSLKRLVCTRLKTKFNTYASFHVLVNEDDFPLVNNIVVWPNGCLIAPFFGRLSPDQIYSSDALTVSVSSKQTTENSLACSSDAAAGGSSETGTPVILIFFIRMSGAYEPNVTILATAFLLTILKFIVLRKPG